MNERTVTKEQVVGAADKYGALIMFQAKMFTEDDLKAAKVCDNVMWDIPIILAKPTDQLSHVSQILQHVRMASIQLLKDDPFFDPWRLWGREPVYFPLLDLNQRPRLIINHSTLKPDHGIGRRTLTGYYNG
ncbi:hypothetical protein HB364_10275 [Pseudoflavitalea sp. X16]|uniref:hypothetical protein n=1 Tax=Paraflavitalea devenefica TaxID=2716334 RepID=UPI001421A81C|nr:hypothetical protein [Paraflavitalea devenefica]NII25469.1 hypothetical protein [Paraflavitalea devenefica]